MCKGGNKGGASVAFLPSLPRFILLVRETEPVSNDRKLATLTFRPQLSLFLAPFSMHQFFALTITGLLAQLVN